MIVYLYQLPLTYPFNIILSSLTLVTSNIPTDPSLQWHRYTDSISNLKVESDSLSSNFPAIFKQQLLKASAIKEGSNLQMLF